MTRATANSWKTLPRPAQREPFGFFALFNDAEAAGACVFGLRLDTSPTGVRIVNSWVCRDPSSLAVSTKPLLAAVGADNPLRTPTHRSTCESGRLSGRPK